MNRLDDTKRVAVVSALVEGCSIRSIVRMTGVSKNTIAKLLVELGAACAEYLDKTLVNLKSERIQCDEIWQFVGAKAKNVPAEKRDQFGIGDVWTWVALDAETKLVAAWYIGDRDADCDGIAEYRYNRTRSEIRASSSSRSDGLPLFTISG